MLKHWTGMSPEEGATVISSDTRGDWRRHLLTMADDSDR
jgi:hypothetical protein